MGVRCHNPFPHDFMNTVRCVSPVGGTATLVVPRYLWVHLCSTCRVSHFTHFSIFSFVVSAICVCDQLNFHNCTKWLRDVKIACRRGETRARLCDRRITRDNLF